MILLIMILLLLMFFVRDGAADENSGVSHVSEFVGVNYKKVVILDVRNPGITYYDYNGDLKKFDTRSEFYKPPDSDEQIKQIMKHGSKVDKSNLMLLMMQIIDAPEQQIVNDLFKSNKDSMYYKKYKNKIILPEISYKVYSRIKSLKIPPGKRFLVFGNSDDQNMKMCEMFSCSEVQVGTAQNIDNFKNNYFDYIVAINLFSYVVDIAYTVRRLHQILKKTGYLIIRENSYYDSFEAMIAEIEAKMFNIPPPIRFPSNDGWDVFLSPFKWYSHRYEIHRLNKKFKRSTRPAWHIYTS